MVFFGVKANAGEVLHVGGSFFQNESPHFGLLSPDFALVHDFMCAGGSDNPVVFQNAIGKGCRRSVRDVKPVIIIDSRICFRTVLLS